MCFEWCRVQYQFRKVGLLKGLGILDVIQSDKPPIGRNRIGCNDEAIFELPMPPFFLLKPKDTNTITFLGGLYKLHGK